MHILTLIKNVPLFVSLLFNLFNTHLKFSAEFWNQDHGERYAKVSQRDHAFRVSRVQPVR